MYEFLTNPRPSRATSSSGRVWIPALDVRGRAAPTGVDLGGVHRVLQPLSALLYFMMVYRAEGPVGGGSRGFELPGAADRRRIRELLGRIHNLTMRGTTTTSGTFISPRKTRFAESCYRAALQRDGADIDFKATWGSACCGRDGMRTRSLCWRRR